MSEDKDEALINQHSNQELVYFCSTSNSSLLFENNQKLKKYSQKVLRILKKFLVVFKCSKLLFIQNFDKPCNWLSLVNFATLYFDIRFVFVRLTQQK